MFKILPLINSPADVKLLTEHELQILASEIRTFLIESVASTGGHLGSNLGVVELTIAIHKVFNSPSDCIIFDTGHQTYTHKLLTGRTDFSKLRQKEGLSGYSCPAESEHDIYENSHASTSLSWASGIAKAKHLQGNFKDSVVVLIGDGALTGGISWEGINNIANLNNEKVIIIINDNGRSYAKTAGRFAQYLQSIRASNNWEAFESQAKTALSKLKLPGRLIKSTLSGAKSNLKNLLTTPDKFFANLGFAYIGPLDGHNFSSILDALTRAKNYDYPVIIHAITQKGRGFNYAINDGVDKFHAVGKFDSFTGEKENTTTVWTKTFSQKIVELGLKDPRILAISAAMLDPTGLAEFSKKFPDRTFDVGIAEEHAICFASSLAKQGFRPVVALYSTFALRSFDQLLMDASLHNAAITLVLDRSGITGSDGKSHHGIFDLATFSLIPNVKIACPYNAKTLQSALTKFVSCGKSVNIIRYPKGGFPILSEKISSKNGLDIVFEDRQTSADLSSKTNDRRLVICFGPLQDLANKHLGTKNITIANLVYTDNFLGKNASKLFEYLLSGFNEVITLEDGIKTGGLGEQLRNVFLEYCEISDFTQNKVPKFSVRGLPKDFIGYGTRDDLLEKYLFTT